MAKPKLRMITSKHIKNVYGKVTIFVCDDSVHSFNLNEWVMYEDKDCIELRRVNKQATEIFFTCNVLRVLFEKNEAKPDIGSPLKPVI